LVHKFHNDVLLLLALAPNMSNWLHHGIPAILDVEIGQALHRAMRRVPVSAHHRLRWKKSSLVSSLQAEI